MNSELAASADSEAAEERRTHADVPSPSKFTRNVVYNLVGFGAPLLAALLSTPTLIHRLGLERFGLLTLIWTLVGYSSIFDLGLGRAVTQLVADRYGRGDERGIPAVVWTAVTLMTALGIVGGVVLAAVANHLVARWLRVPEVLQTEMRTALYLVALSLPVTITTTALRGVLEAQHRFGVANVIRIGLGVFTFWGPLLVLPFSVSLGAVVAVLVLSRLVGWAVYCGACFRTTPGLANGVSFRRDHVRPLLRFGSWMTVSNIISPLLVSIDRFIIGAVLASAVVAYYTTPFEIVSKLGVIAAAVSTVLFPAFSSTARTDAREAAALYRFGMNVLALLLIPAVLAFLFFSKAGLTLWIGASFASQSYRIAQTLSVAFLLNSIAAVPFALVQGAGRPDITAKLHLIELPVYVVALYSLLRMRGLAGVADAWLLRVVVDTVLLMTVAARLLRQRIQILHVFAAVAAAVVAISASIFEAIPLPIRAVAFVVVSVLCLVGAWSQLRARRHFVQ